MKHRNALILMSAAALCFSSPAEDVNIKPGKYETTAVITLTKAMTETTPSTTKLPQQKSSVCMTAADLKTFAERQAPQDKEHCTTADFQVSASKASFTVKCNRSGKIGTTSVQMTFEGEAYRINSSVHTENSLLTTTTSITAKRVGDCTK